MTPAAMKAAQPKRWLAAQAASFFMLHLVRTPERALRFSFGR